MPRLYREAPVNSIWEGSGNVNALDVLRAMRREPSTLSALFQEIEEGRSGDVRLGRAIDDLKKDLGGREDIETRARHLVERMAIVLEASLLLRFGDPAVAELFVASRVAGDWGHTFGTLKPDQRLKSVIERHQPRL